mgnify:CR=1 FL=1
MSLPYKSELIPFAKKLRADMTPQERRLWYCFLREYPIRFQRQKAIKSFIADFYCHKAGLIIEIDGSQHYTEEGIAYDRERTNMLKEFNLEVIRFSNIDIDDNFEGVCRMIDNQISQKLGINKQVFD